MSEENAKRFIEATEAFNRGDVEGYLRFMDPEVEFEPIQTALQGTYAGHEGVREWFGDLFEHYVMEDSDISYTEVRDLGDRVLGIGTLRYTGKGSGISTETPMVVMGSYRNGLVTQLRAYANREQALKAAGLQE